MADLNYTKGEWRIEHYPDSQIKIHSGFESICGLTYDGKVADEVEANAHLIAAAPDMYEALERLVDYLNYLGVPEDCEDQYEEANKALAKAEGKEDK